MRVVAAWLLPLALAAPTSLELWEANRDSAVASLTDEFVLGIGAGTLRREAFATYEAGVLLSEAGRHGDAVANFVRAAKLAPDLAAELGI